MFTVLVTDVGRSPALNFCRALRLTNEEIFIVGLDTNKFSLTWAEADVKLLSPECTNEKYINYINYVIDKYKVNLMYPSKTGDELLFLAENQQRIHAPLFLPDLEDLQLFEDKWRTYLLVKDLCKAPQTYLVHNKKELYYYMQEITDGFKKEVWIRRIYGSGGSGSIATNDYMLAKAWIDRNDGWGKFTVSKKLTNKTMTWSGLWKNGELVASLTRERMYWEFANRAPSGVTGITGAQCALFSEELNDVSQKVIKALSKHPNGCIGVDYTLDDEGCPNLTEIQPGRMYTSSHFMAKCGINFPYLFCKLALNIKISKDELNYKINEDMLWLKYVETYPSIVSKAYIQNEVDSMNQILSKL